MENRSNEKTQLERQELCCEALISHNAYSFRNVYHPETAFLRLGTSELIEVDVITDGQGIHCVLGQDIPCKVGDVFVTAPGISHGYFCEGAGENLSVRRIAFDSACWLDARVSTVGKPDYCHGVFRESTVVACAVLVASQLERVYAMYDAIESETTERGHEWRSAVRGYLSILLISISRCLDRAIKNVSIASPAEWDTVLSVIRSVEENYGDPHLTLETIAEALYISKAHLSALFYRVAGRHFSDYLRGVRLDRARVLLERTDMTVEAVMKECGLRDITSFYKNFSSYVHMTPTEYRKSMAQTDDESDEYKKLLRGEKVMSIFNEISANIQAGKAKLVKELVQQALDEGVKPADILDQGLLVGMGIIGEKFKNNEIYVPEVLVAARAMNMGAQILKPHLAASGVVATGKVCIGTVQGDLHDIGKNLVKMMLEGKGLEVVDLGTDVSAERFVQTAIEENCQVICCSALLTTTMGVMADVVKAAEAAGIRDKVKIMVGGAPVNEDFCKKIGADCYTVDAASAADAAAEFCKA